MKFINKLFRDEAGATAIEYGLIAALIASLFAVGAFAAEAAGWEGKCPTKSARPAKPRARKAKAEAAPAASAGDADTESSDTGTDADGGPRRGWWQRTFGDAT